MAVAMTIQRITASTAPTMIPTEGSGASISVFTVTQHRLSYNIIVYQFIFSNLTVLYLQVNTKILIC